MTRSVIQASFLKLSALILCSMLNTVDLHSIKVLSESILNSATEIIPQPQRKLGSGITVDLPFFRSGMRCKYVNTKLLSLLLC